MEKKIALYLLAITIVWTMIEHFLGFNTTNHAVGEHARMLTTFIFYFAVGLTVWRKRNQLAGTMSFAEGFKSGALVSVIYGALVSVWFAIYAEVINKQYQPSLLEFERKRLEASNASAEEIAQKLAQVEMQSGGSLLSYFLLFIFMTVGGLIIAAIAALIFRRKR